MTPTGTVPVGALARVPPTRHNCSSFRRCADVRTLHYTPSHLTFRIFLAVLERLFLHMNFGVRSSSSPIRILLSLMYISKTVTVSIQDIFPEGKNHQLEQWFSTWQCLDKVSIVAPGLAPSSERVGSSRRHRDLPGPQGSSATLGKPSLKCLHTGFLC